MKRMWARFLISTLLAAVVFGHHPGGAHAAAGGLSGERYAAAVHHGPGAVDDGASTEAPCDRPCDRDRPGECCTETLSHCPEILPRVAAAQPEPVLSGILLSAFEDSWRRLSNPESDPPPPRL